MAACTPAEELRKLRMSLCDKWIAHDTFLRLFDVHGNGLVDYDEFHDWADRFGLENVADIPACYRAIDPEGVGLVPKAALEAALVPSEVDLHETVHNLWTSHVSDGQPPYPTEKLVALIAHNNMKAAMLKFVKAHVSFFKRVKLATTGSTGRAIHSLGLSVAHTVSSGPLGGDQEIGALVARKQVVAVFFFVDPLTAHPHSADVEALERICCVHDCMVANNPSTANALVYSLQHSAYALSRLLGVNPEMLVDSQIVKSYKEQQQQVVDQLAATRDIHGPASAGREEEAATKGATDVSQSRGRSHKAAPCSVFSYIATSTLAVPRNGRIAESSLF